MSAHDRFLDYRRSLPRPPRLDRRTVRVRGLDLAVFTTPAVPGAPPLLCVNGGLLFDHTLLWPALAPLAARRQLVLYDQRGRGASQPPPGVRAARIEHDAGDLPALRVALGIDRWDVLGHSWGGGIAMLGAAQDQAATRRLVLVDPVGVTSAWLDALHDGALARLAPAGRAALDAASEALAAAGGPDPALSSDYSQALYPAWFASAELAAMFAPPRSASRAGAAVSTRLREEGYDWRPLLADLRVPTLVIHGESDLLPVSVARETAALLPRARLALVPDAGHMPFWEAPREFFRLVEEFLRG
jgi:pimeloyl-ACP methyl ester carboxylesterase